MNKPKLKGLKRLVIIESVIIALLSASIIFFIADMIIQVNTPYKGYDTIGMSQKEKNIFNGRFESYVSEKQLSGNTKALISAVISNNESNVIDEEGKEKGPKQISIETNFYIDKAEVLWTSEYLSKVRSAVKQGNTYAVELIYGDNGLIREIKIVQNEQIKVNNTL